MGNELGREGRRDWIWKRQLDGGLEQDYSNEMARRANLGMRLYFVGRTNRTY